MSRFDSEFGQKIYKNVSKQAWGEWVERQKMLLNEYRLQPGRRKRRRSSWSRWKSFFFGTGSRFRRSTCRPRTKGQMPHAAPLLQHARRKRSSIG